MLSKMSRSRGGTRCCRIAVGIDKKGLNRLIRSLELGKAWVGLYRNLMGGGVTHQLSGRDFNDLLRKVADNLGGVDIALDILSMRLSFAGVRARLQKSSKSDVSYWVESNWPKEQTPA